MKKLTNEKKSEIIKSLAFGMEPVEIAELERVSVGEVENILNDFQAEIAECAAFMKMKGGGLS
jgi:DNA-directed RNA polymerase specialized sigma24 family protein